MWRRSGVFDQVFQDPLPNIYFNFIYYFIIAIHAEQARLSVVALRSVIIVGDEP